MANRYKASQYSSGRITASGTWLRNSARSIGTVGASVVRNVMPATFDTASSMTRQAADMKDFLRDFRANSNTMARTLNNSGSVDELAKGFQNIKDDLKSGNFNNVSRANSSFMDDMDLGGWGFDDTSSSSDMDFGSDSGASEVTYDTQIVSKSVLSASGVQTQAINTQTDELNSSIKAGAVMQNKTATATLAQMQYSSGVIIDGINAINNNLGTMLKMVDSSLVPFVNASLQYYNDSMEVLNKINDNQLKMLEYQSNKYNGAKKTGYNRNNKTDFLTATGFDMKEYAKIVKDNFKKTFESSSVGMMGSMMDKSMVQSMSSNPLMMFLPGILEKGIPKNVKNSMKNFDSMFKNFSKGMLMKLSSKDTASNPYMALFAKIFGIKTDKKNGVDLGKWSSSMNDAEMTWDMTSYRTLNEAIPYYLRKMTSALTGEEEIFYDPKTNRYKKGSKLKRDIRKEMDMNTIMQYSENYFDLKDNIGKVTKNNPKARKSANDNLTKFLVELSKTDKLISPTKTKNFDSDLNKLMQQAGITPEASRVLVAAIHSLSKGKQASLFVNNAVNAREARGNYIRGAEDNMQTFYNLARVMGEDGFDMNSLMKANPKFVKGFKGKGNPASMIAKGGSFASTDEFGMTGMKYLRNIETLLLEGIRVFPMYEWGSSDSNPKHIQKILNDRGKVDTGMLKRSSATRVRPLSEETLRNYKKQGKQITDSIEDGSATDAELLKMMGGGQTTNKAGGYLKNRLGNKFGKYITNNKLKKYMDSGFQSVSSFVSGIAEIPSKFVSGIFDSASGAMYKVLFGEDIDDTSDGKNDYMFSSDISKSKGLVNKITTGMVGFFGNAQDWLVDHIFDPLHEKMFGENGWFANDKVKNTFTSGKNKVMNGLFGAAGANGVRAGGPFSDISNTVKDEFRSIGAFFTGRNYTDSTGKLIKHDGPSVFGEIKSTFNTISDAIKSKYLGVMKDENGEKKSIFDVLDTGIADFKSAILGKDVSDEDKQGLFKKSWASIKSKLPKGLAGGTIGLGAGLLGGGGGALGALTGLFLPGGPIGGMILGAGIGFAKQSDKAKEFIFGPEDVNGERIGGLVNKDIQSFFAKNKKFIIGSAGVGAAKGLFGKVGIIPSFFLGGGPIGGALLGAATGIAYKSNIVQDFLFGKADEEGKRANTGFVNKVLTSLHFEGKGEDGKKLSFKPSTAAMGAMGGAALAPILGQFGLLGAMATFGGSPIMGALVGAGAGIAASAKTWREKIFGKVNDEGVGEDGVLSKGINKAMVTIVDPIKDKLADKKLKVEEWFIKGIAQPVAKAFDPITVQLKYIGEWLGKKKDKLGDWFKGVFNETVGSPIVNIFSKAAGLAGKTVSTGFGLMTSAAMGAIGAPFKVLGKVGDLTRMGQERRGLKNYKRGINANGANMSFYERMQAKYFDSDARSAARKGEYGSQTEYTRAEERERDRADRRQYNAGLKDQRKSGQMDMFEYLNKRYINRSDRPLRGEFGRKWQGTLDDKRAKRAEEKEQMQMRREYAKQMGYRNVDDAGKDISWIYNNATFSRDENGKISAKQKAQLKTHTDQSVEDISKATSTVVDKLETTNSILSSIESAVRGTPSSIGASGITTSGSSLKPGVSGAKVSGGSLRSLFSGKDDGKAESAENQKGYEAQAKTVKRKDITFINAQNAEKEKEEREQAYQEATLANLEEINETGRTHSSVWNSIFSKKGLLTAGLIAAAALFVKGGGIGGIVKGVKSIITGANSLGEDPEQRTLESGELIENENLRERNNAVRLGTNVLTRTKGGRAVSKGATWVGGKAVDAVKGKIGKKVTEETAEQVMQRAMVGGTESVTKSASKRFMDKILKGMTEFFANKTVVKKIGEKAAKVASNEVVEKISKALTESVLKKAAGKIGTAMTKMAAKAASYAGTAGIAAGAFGIYDAISGSSKSETANLFEVNTEEVDAKMRMISGLMKTLLGFFLIGALVDVADEIVAEQLGWSLKKFIATTIYNAISDQEDQENLSAAQKAQDAEFAKWQEENPDEDISKNAYNDMTNRSWLGKTWDKFTGKKYTNAEKTSSTPEYEWKQNTNANQSNPVMSTSTDRYSSGTIVKKSDAGQGGFGGEISPLGFGPSGSTTTTSAESKFMQMSTAIGQAANVMDTNLGKVLGLTDANGKVVPLTTAVNTNATETPMTTIEQIGVINDSLYTKAKDILSDQSKKAMNNFKKFPKAFDNMMGGLMGFSGTSLSNGVKNSTTSNKTSSSLGSNIMNGVGSFFKGVGSSIGNGLSSIKNKLFGNGPDTYYSQNDPRWAGSEYAPASGRDASSNTISARGCGPTAMAMVASDLTGQRITPDTMSNYSSSKGYSVKGGTSWNMVPSASNSLGLQSNSMKNPSGSSLKSQLASGKEVIVSGVSNYPNQPGSPFTSRGHYVVLKGNKNGKTVVRDPNGPAKNGVYDINSIASQTNMGWSVGKKQSRKAKGLGEMNNILQFTRRNLKGLGPDNVEDLKAIKICKTAQELIGKPYIFGGNDFNKGTDCSGVAYLSYQKNGVSIPRNTEQMRVGIARSITNASDLRPGDIMLVGNPSHHACLYIGGGKTIEAHEEGRPIVYETADGFIKYWTGTRGESWVGKRPLSDSDVPSEDIDIMGDTSGAVAGSSDSTIEQKSTNPFSLMNTLYSNMYDMMVFGHDFDDLDWVNGGLKSSDSSGTTSSLSSVGGENVFKLSRKYESNGDPGAVSWDSMGGNSYGLYQFAHKTGGVDEFMNFIKTKYPQYYERLNHYTWGSSAFSDQWKSLAKEDPTGFAKAQDDAVYQKYFMQVAKNLNGEYDVTSKGDGVQAAILSGAIQHGASGITNIIRRVLAANGKDVDDPTFIKAFYQGRRDAFVNNPYKDAVWNRFDREVNDALGMGPEVIDFSKFSGYKTPSTSSSRGYGFGGSCPTPSVITRSTRAKMPKVKGGMGTADFTPRVAQSATRFSSMTSDSVINGNNSTVISALNQMVSLLNQISGNTADTVNGLSSIEASTTNIISNRSNKPMIINGGQQANTNSPEYQKARDARATAQAIASGDF